MPHFYNVSNNLPEVLPEDQKKFPDAEIYSVVYYIFRESREYLAGKDTAYRFLKDREKELKDKLKNNLIAEQERKDLEEVERRLQVANEYRFLKDREEELLPKEKAKQLSESERRELEEARVRLRTLKPLAPIREQMLSAEGEVVQLPAAPPDEKARQEQIKSGRQLFTEKGCLACHSHDSHVAAVGQASGGDKRSGLRPQSKPDRRQDLAGQWRPRGQTPLAGSVDHEPKRALLADAHADHPPDGGSGFGRGRVAAQPTGG